jgi:5-methylcytosine-specific restriction endonuclease McrA
MKRGGPLRRLTPLRSKTSDPSELRNAKEIVKQRSGGRCEARIPSVCIGRASEVHHIKSRARGGGHDPANLLDLCTPCHRFVTENPRSATQMGFLKHAWED